MPIRFDKGSILMKIDRGSGNHIRRCYDAQSEPPSYRQAPLAAVSLKLNLLRAE